LEPLHAGVESELPPRGAALLAVAALAGPALFAAQLRERGYRVDLAAFPDHHPYSERDAAAILDRADGRPVVVTLKDAVKLRSLLPAARVLVLRQRVRILGGGEALDVALRRTLSGGTG
ncbi:MAG: tetraacyldisaccharide 4'-kinase, partial [Gemmatimonadota bacterium]|nr:tetraacyldisaccharide 4'-kinase [Gemmatimonadota bacterium]